MKKELVLPVWQKMNITLEEAAEYTGIGKTKLRELSDKEDYLIFLKTAECIIIGILFLR